jgi:hypothetical protein
VDVALEPCLGVATTFEVPVAEGGQMQVGNNGKLQELQHTRQFPRRTLDKVLVSNSNALRLMRCFEGEQSASLVQPVLGHSQRKIAWMLRHVGSVLAHRAIPVRLDTGLDSV